MNLLIKNLKQWSIGSDRQCCTLTNLVEKSTKLKCEKSHMEFVEINIITNFFKQNGTKCQKSWKLNQGR